MTLLAGQCGVFPGQWEAAQGVIKARITPAGGAVAPGAVTTVLAIVFVIADVAGNTVERGAFELAITVAICAGYAGMRIAQREARVVVIESDVSPAICDMAGLAVCAELAIVMVILAVAVDAAAGGAVKLAAAVTGTTVCHQVRASQRKRGLVMIEGDVAPAVSGMAARAVRAKLPIMLIVGLMAANAVFGCAGEITIGMALRTFCRGVCPV